MKLDIVLGLQWGDEGKGKIVDVLAGRYPSVARFQGGPNAGHSLQFGGRTFVAKSLPSGIFRDGCVNIIGNGVVLDPIAFQKECRQVAEFGVDARERVLVSKKATIIVPTHRYLDAAGEAAAGKGKIGTTNRGIGPSYTDKVARHALRVGDILQPDFIERWNKLKERHLSQLELLGYGEDPSREDDAFISAVKYLRSFRIINSEYFVNNWLDTKPMLAEGAQGTLLDVDHGSYPFVTSSNTTVGGAVTGLGVAPQRIGRVYGVFKAYCTRVGSGPFPTELFDETGEKIRQVGHEFGAVTGRPRRTGWLDLIALKYAVTINGVTDLVMMKADCLDSFDKIKVCTAYRIDGELSYELPAETDARIEPVYTEFEGWNTDLEGLTDASKLPRQFNDYVDFLERELGVRISIISLGPDRNTIIER